MGDARTKSLMAGGSEKKNRAKNKQTLQYLGGSMGGVMSLFLLWRVGYHWDSFSFWIVIFAAMVITGTLLSYSMLSQLHRGHQWDILDFKNVGEVWFDLFCVSLATLVLTTFTDWGYLLYLSVPMYAIWSFIISPFLNWVFTEDPDAKETQPAGMSRKDR